MFFKYINDIFSQAILILLCVFLVEAQYAVPQDLGYGIPNPYQYSYSSPAIGGSSSHQESGDGTGRVTGSYSVVDEDGRSRTVEYVADELGFRANIVTNEPGTSNQAPADVTISSSADDGFGGVYAAPAPVPVPVGGLPYGGLPYAAA
ncbi:UNVERIFIED_CONTAM: Cuticle protein 10.9 [Trichonephila clavipes]